MMRYGKLIIAHIDTAETFPEGSEHFTYYLSRAHYYCKLQSKEFAEEKEKGPKLRLVKSDLAGDLNKRILELYK